MGRGMVASKGDGKRWVGGSWYDGAGWGWTLGFGWEGMMAIEGLSLKNVGPFDEIEFEFDPQVNVFTGPNNSGKSSALLALGGLLRCFRSIFRRGC